MTEKKAKSPPPRKQPKPRIKDAPSELAALREWARTHAAISLEELIKIGRSSQLKRLDRRAYIDLHEWIVEFAHGKTAATKVEVPQVPSQVILIDINSNADVKKLQNGKFLSEALSQSEASGSPASTEAAPSGDSPQDSS
jgi:hypothetical protein